MPCWLATPGRCSVHLRSVTLRRARDAASARALQTLRRCQFAGNTAAWCLPATPRRDGRQTTLRRCNVAGPLDFYNSPGRRPNGVYDRFPLGGFTLLYGSLLGSHPRQRNFDSTRDFAGRPSGRRFFGHPKNHQKNDPSIFSFLCIFFRFPTVFR